VKAENVITMPTRLNPDHVLECAKGEYQTLFIIGMDKDGVMDVRAGGDITVAELVFLLEKFKHKLLAGEYDP
jgi:hypothetical protein